MFVELPSEVVTDVLKTWIVLRDLSRLDAACCNRNSRSVFLTLLTQTDYSGSPVPLLPEESIVAYMNWAANRNVLSKCEKLSYHSKCISSTGSASRMSETLLEVSKSILSDDAAQIHSACMIVLELNSTRDLTEFFEPDIVARMVTLLQHHNTNIVMYSLGIVGNFLLDGADAINQLLELDLLATLQQMLTHPNDAIAQHVYGVITNVLLGTQEHIQAVLDTGLLPKFIVRLQNKDSDFRQDAIHALRNIADRGTVPQQLVLAQLGAVPALCNILGLLYSTNTIAVLKIVEKLFALVRGAPLQNTIQQEVIASGGVAKLQALAASYSVGSFRAESLLQRYFPPEYFITRVPSTALAGAAAAAPPAGALAAGLQADDAAAEEDEDEMDSGSDSDGDEDIADEVGAGEAVETDGGGEGAEGGEDGLSDGDEGSEQEADAAADGVGESAGEVEGEDEVQVESGGGGAEEESLVAADHHHGDRDSSTGSGDTGADAMETEL